MTTEQLIIKIKDINSEIHKYDALLAELESNNVDLKCSTTIKSYVLGKSLTVDTTYNTVLSVLYSKLEELRVDLTLNTKLLLDSLK